MWAGPADDVVHHLDHHVFVLVAPGINQFRTEPGERRERIGPGLPGCDVFLDHGGQILVSWPWLPQG